MLSCGGGVREMLLRRSLVLSYRRTKAYGFGSGQAWENPMDEDEHFSKQYESKQKNHYEEMYRKDQQRRLSKERLYKELLGLDSGLQYKKAELQNAFRDRAKALHPDTSSGDEAEKDRKAAQFEEVMIGHKWLIDSKCYIDEESKSKYQYTGRLYPDRSEDERLNITPIENLFDFEKLKQPSKTELILRKMAVILSAPFARHRVKQEALMKKGPWQYPAYVLARLITWMMIFWFFVEYIGYAIRSTMGELNPDMYHFHRWENLQFRLPLGYRLSQSFRLSSS